jgi:hypothetical protein
MLWGFLTNTFYGLNKGIKGEIIELLERISYNRFSYSGYPALHHTARLHTINFIPTPFPTTTIPSSPLPTTTIPSPPSFPP